MNITGQCYALRKKVQALEGLSLYRQLEWLLILDHWLMASTSSSNPLWIIDSRVIDHMTSLI